MTNNPRQRPWDGIAQSNAWLRLTTLSWWHVGSWAVVSMLALAALPLALEHAAQDADDEHAARIASTVLETAEREFDTVTVLLQGLSHPFPDICATDALLALSQLDFDVAEVRDFGVFDLSGRLVCTSRLGKLAQPLPAYPPDATYGKAAVNVALTSLMSERQRVYAVKVGDFNALMDGGRWTFGAQRENLTIHIDDKASGKAVMSAGSVHSDGTTVTRAGDHFVVNVTSFGDYARQYRSDRQAWLLPALALAAFCALLVLRQLVGRVRATPTLLKSIVHFSPELVSVVFQPILGIEDTRVQGAETLLRMKDRKGRTLPPGMVFEVLANSPRLCRALTALVMDKSIRQLREWLQEDRQRFLGINLSPHDLSSPFFTESVRQHLQRHGLEARQLHFELLESAEFSSEQTARTLQSLRELGCELWIDDFGVGYSNLARLHTLPIHGVKLDREWVEGLDDSQHVRADAVSHLVLFAGSNGLGVVAEGVSDELAMRTLLRLGVQQMQGFLFAPGLPLDEFLRISHASGSVSGRFRNFPSESYA